MTLSSSDSVSPEALEKFAECFEVLDADLDDCMSKKLGLGMKEGNVEAFIVRLAGLRRDLLDFEGKEDNV